MRTIHTWYVWIGVKYSSISLMASHCANRKKRRARNVLGSVTCSHVSAFFCIHMQQIHSGAVSSSHMIIRTYVSLLNHIRGLLGLTLNKTCDDSCHTACMPVRQLYGMLYLNLSEGEQHVLSFQMIGWFQISLYLTVTKLEWSSVWIIKENVSHHLSLSFSLVLNWH